MGKLKLNAKKGTWGVRMMILLLTIVAGILFYSLLSLVISDIRSMKEPSYEDVYNKMQNPDLKAREDQLKEREKTLDANLKALQEERELKASSSKNLEQTLNQLNKQTGIAQNGQMKETMDKFLDFQKEYQELNSRILTLTQERQQVIQEEQSLFQQQQDQENAIQKELNKRHKNHRLVQAMLELALLLPLLFVFFIIFLRKRGPLVTPLMLALGCATLLHVFISVHEYFPSQWSKYILIVASILIIIRLLSFLVKLSVAPKPERLMLQYSQAYERFLCPVCEYPIRIGPLKFLFWTRNSANSVLNGKNVNTKDIEIEPYTCPACGELLYDKCEHCGKIRHTLLPYCEHCGQNKENPLLGKTEPEKPRA